MSVTLNTRCEPARGKTLGLWGYGMGEKRPIEAYTPPLCKCTMVAAHPGPLLVLTLWSSGTKQKNKVSNLQWEVNFAAYGSGKGGQSEKRHLGE